MRSLRPHLRLVALLAVCLASAERSPASGLGVNADKLASDLVAAGRLPPAPDGVQELRFSDIYRMPAGPRGIELTERAAALSGKRVRILGYMVRQSRPIPGVALLAPYTIITHEAEYGLCDDLPPATLFVEVPKYADLAVPYTPGPLLLAGRFETGPREEPDGRVSHLRLILDDEDAANAEATTTGAGNPGASPEPTAVPTAAGRAALADR